MTLQEEFKSLLDKAQELVKSIELDLDEKLDEQDE